ncbi:hypothetical protein [Cerasicoccus maritimus]|uniref:hypothetical protein n=1 Tax=Cerasicoccus maritimus TaxID=490089 RepID=UPI00285277F4|nr:hypothetical protein [Cerasicoccus maritimus]
MASRVNAVLVAGDGTALVTEIIAKVVSKHRSRITFTGPGVFDHRIKRHIRATVLPLIDSILTELDVSLPCFELSVVNPAVASSMEAAVRVSGFSVDVPIALALLGAACGMPVKSSVVATGHIASSAGDIRMVRSLDQKVQAVVTRGKGMCFVYPQFDASSDLPSGDERERIDLAFRKIRFRVRLQPISQFSQALTLAFAEHDLFLASLTCGYYGRESADSTVIRDLGLGEGNRFIRVLEQHLRDTDMVRIQEVLGAWIRFLVKNGQYPHGVGRELHALLQSIPPAVRRLKLRFPLIASSEVMRLAPLVGSEDTADFQQLLRAIEGNIAVVSVVTHGVEDFSDSCDAAEIILDAILSELDEAAIYEQLCAPMDRAFNLFQIPIEGSFHDLVFSFYAALMRAVDGCLESDNLASDAYALVERAYARNGGIKGATTDAETPGGRRVILERMLQTLRKERVESHIQYVFHQAIDPLDYAAKLAVTKAFIVRFRSVLPEQVVDDPPEKYAQSWYVLIRHWLEMRTEFQEWIHMR